ncbi:1-acyl-sn-glycerol-3-phosphate acyltransferase [Anaerovirgula multivorans]|uniref:1-acyl-sn-glycerol-3-phosphate acyltransferase n=1 Tax=Anaerovirgula multivorans TaxID=312168 RepID=A0A239GXS1_9FIRM|nr:lysophospholipid acyltransferase family protein [Anaerovirgula multivorans]SNS73950.1 1-acyl-sn-glycerol-3-phosphate acyltransferase [Anaerovirgula multivorans]
MRTLIWMIYFWLYAIASIIYYPKINYYVKKGLIQERREFAHKFTANWARSLIALSGSKIEVTGIENIPSEGAVLFASNHQGNFDIPILMGYLQRPIGFIAKIELKKMPIISRWMKVIDCVFIDRKDIRQSLRVMTQAIDILKSGQSMVIFPEGSRSMGNEMTPFKPGSLKIAARSNTPIIPITIIGSYKMMESNNNRIQPAHVKVIISPAINPYQTEKTSDLTVTIHNIIKENLIKYTH